MSERLPIGGENELEIHQRKAASIQELQKQDLEDPERGPSVRMARKVCLAAYSKPKENPLFDELASFQRSFIAHFGRADAQRYRLFHYMTGSTPNEDVDLFDFVDPDDAEERWSIATAMQNLSEKYHIHSEGV